MIKYALRCGEGHEFESWFRDSATYETLEQHGHLSCPECGDTHVRRAIMKPAVGRGASGNAPYAADGEQPTLSAKDAARLMRRAVERHCAYVGKAFPDEARKLHNGDSAHLGVYGEASRDQLEALADDGIRAVPLPGVRDDA